MKVLFIATVGIAVRDPEPNKVLFRDVLGLSLQRHEVSRKRRSCVAHRDTNWAAGERPVPPR